METKGTSDACTGAKTGAVYINHALYYIASLSTVIGSRRGDAQEDKCPNSTSVGEIQVCHRNLS